MSSVGAVLTGISILCIVAGVALLVGQVRARPAAPVPGPSGNGSEPQGRAQQRPAPPAVGRVAPGRGEATRRRRILAALLVAMIASLAAALVVGERWVWGVHLFLDDAFLGYVAWLARRAETRTRASAVAPESEPAVETRPMRRRSTAGSGQAENEDGEAGKEARAEAEAEVTDARA